ncbi:DDI1 homolog 2 isoform X2 [Paramuricea clavata]|uniref:DDI1 homolog 2 isoform X2 n=1 Tax=Paramuricea clavata TaxID=317549 RepID=A0A6S7L914_PARCT|nr:DDI1 homolog 2 isoform X2 [Paramuricea clavata]
MKISVTFEDNLYSLDISDDSEIEILKPLLEFESGVPASDFAIYYNGYQLKEVKKSLKYFGVKDGDILVMTRRMPRPPQQNQRSSGVGSIDWSSIRVPGTSSRVSSTISDQGGQVPLGSVDPLALREVLLADAHRRSLLKERNPPLSEALESGDPQRFVAVFNQQKKTREEQEALRMRMIQADPLDIEAQQQIAEEIQQANINTNMETAFEFSPESFGQVTMLYINCLVNGQPVKAFVDSGAQMTIMSVACAERCNIMRLLDRRWAGLAKGVGTQKIIGRVHVAQIQIEQDFLASSFSVLEAQPMDMLLGLDMLKRHQV